MSLPTSIPNSNRLSTPAVVYFGRENEVNSIVGFLKRKQQNLSSGKVCEVHGLQGAGKTELCQVVADELHREYSDAQVYIKIQEADKDAALLHKVFEIIIHIFDPLAHLSEDLAALHMQYLSALDGNKVLVVLDDLPSNENVEFLMPPPSCALLITARESLEIPAAMSLQLVGLSQENSEKLLTHICPRIGTYAPRLSRICRNNPLRLRLIAGHLAEKSSLEVDTCIDELEERVKRVEADEHNEPLITEQFVSHIFEQIQPTEKELFLELGIIPDGFKAEQAVEITKRISDGEDELKTIQSYLDAFVRMNLLAYDGARKYYRMHSLVQNYALKSIENESAAWLGFAEANAGLVEEFMSLARRNADGFLLSLLLFDEYKSNIKKIIQYLRGHSSVSLDSLKLGLFGLVNLYGRCRFLPLTEMVPIMETEVDVALRLNNADKLLSVLDDLSKAYLALGETKRALDYSHMRERIIQDRQGYQANQTLEEIRFDRRNVDLVVPHEVNVNQSELTQFNVEQFSNEKTKIVLTGFMGTGKTTVGKLLADLLNYSFIDTDELIESQYGRSISDIFLEFGEEAFREMERRVVKEVGNREGVVISTGGRLMLDPENVNILSRNSRVFCLVATPDEILTRVSKDVSHIRPLLSVPNPKEHIVDLLQERKDRYRRFPQIVTDEKEPTDVARGLVEYINTSPKSIVVENPQESYEYLVGAGLLPFIRELTGIKGEIVIVTDEVVKALYGPSCASIGQIIEVPRGRQHKSLATVQFLYDRLLDGGFDRTGTIISLGGSVVGDIAGFVAATYMRGVNFVYCPTSLISMVDTSVGGKTGIDLPQGKNIIGVYKQPSKVIADVGALLTLPQSDFASGMAEIVKYGLLVESNLLEQIEHGHWVKNWDRSPSYISELQRLVAQAIQVKINIVQADPFEQGPRSVLNLGHTFAHAIELVSNNAYRHGEAVSIGLVAAANLSAGLGFCDASLQIRIETILKSVNLPTRFSPSLKPDALLQAMQRDKKKQAGRLRFILVSGIGHPFVSDNVSNDAILDTISVLNEGVSPKA
jgi:3-dehydroquinate synthase